GLRCASLVFFSLRGRPPPSTLFPYTTLFRSSAWSSRSWSRSAAARSKFWSRTAFSLSPLMCSSLSLSAATSGGGTWVARRARARSEEHTSELQSRGHLVCRLLLEKKNKTQQA